MYFANNYRFQDTLVYQPTLDKLGFKKGKGTDIVLRWKSKRVYNSKIKPSYTAFLHIIPFSGYRMGVKFHK